MGKIQQRSATEIHPSAIVDEGAELGEGVKVSPFAIIEDDVTIGDGTWVGPNAFVGSGTTIGAECQLHHGAVVGHIPQDKDFVPGTVSYVEVGDRTVIREYVTLHRGTEPGSKTIVGNDNLLMACCHVAHDCVIDDNVILANAVLLAGYVHVEDYAVIAGGAAVQQFCKIGKLAIVGGNVGVNKDVPPFVMATGYPARAHGLNRIGLKRYGLESDKVEALKRAYRILYRSGLPLEQALDRIEEEILTDEARYLVNFCRGPLRCGICRDSSRKL